jgi:hypothetical protein
MYRCHSSNDLTTANAGVLPLAGLLQKYDLVYWMDEHLPAYSSNRAYQPHEYAFLQLANHATGGNCLEDSRAISEDGALKELLKLADLPAPNTLGDWFRTATWGQSHRLRKRTRELVWDILRQRGSKEVQIDIDAKVHESDNRSARWTYKGVRGYCPLYVTVPDEKLVLDALFRPGNRTPQEHNASMVRTLLNSCPAWVEKLEVSLDAAGWQTAVITAMQRANKKAGLRVNFYIRPAVVSENPVYRVNDAISTLEEDEWDSWEPRGDQETDPRGRELAETVLTIGRATDRESPKAIRLVVVREPLGNEPTDQLALEDAQRYRYITVATNNDKLAPQEIVQRYNRRGAAEDVIGEVVADGTADRFPMQSDEGNALYLGLNILTFNLLQHMKDHDLPPEWGPLTPASLKRRVINVAVRISKHARYRNIKFPQSFPWEEEFRKLLKACWS